MSHGALPQSERLAGIATAGELAAAGLTYSRIRALVQQSVLTPVGRGIYARAAPAAALTGRPDRRHALQLAAALAVTGPGAAGSHHSAAVIHGLDLLGSVPDRAVTVTRPAGTGRTPRRGIHLYSSALPGAHVVTLADGVRVTSVARTVVDLARSSSFRAGVVTADSALHRRLTSAAQLQAVLGDCARWRGVGQARQVVTFSDGRSESAFESLSRVVFREQGLPPPDLQVWVGAEGVGTGRADFLWREYRTIGEADGLLKYGDPSRARAQLQRDAVLRDAGFEVVHFTWAQVTRAPGQVAASLRAAFGRNRR